MAVEEPASERDVERAAADARAHPEREALASLVWEILGRPAGERGHRGRRQLVRRRAKRYGVTRQAAGTRLGNLVAVLENGPKDARERALLAAYAVQGLAVELGRVESGEARSELLRKFVARADRWEAAEGLGVYTFVEQVLPEALAHDVWQAVGESMRVVRHGGGHTRASRRAAEANRVTALAEASHPAARHALAEVASRTADPVTRAAATAALEEATARGADPEPRGPTVPEGAVSPGADSVARGAARPERFVPTHPQQAAPADAEARPRVEGTLRKVPRSRSVQVLRWVSGWALLVWLVRALAGLTGWKRQGRWELDGHVIRIRTRTIWLGRVIRESEEHVSVGSLLAGTRRVRYAWLHLIVGVMVTAVGVLVGVALFHDALRTGERTFLWIGAAVILASAGLDLLLDAVWSGRRRRVVLELRVRQQGRLCLRSVPLEHADRFLERLAACFPEPEGA